MSTPPDPSKKEIEPEIVDFGPVHDTLAKGAIDNFKKDGRVYTTILFVQLARPISRRLRPVRTQPMDPRLAHQFLSTREGRDQLTVFLRRVLTAGAPERETLRRTVGFEPDLIVHLDEAWMAHAQTMEEASRIAPSEQPDRKEVVLISIHHRWGGTITNTLPIIQLPQRHVKFQPLPKGLIATLGPMAMTPDNRA